MLITTDALVIKESNIGDNDRMVTLMTRNNGVITAFATGAKSIKSRRGSATGLLSYSNFTLDKKGETYKITEASVNKVFFDVGSDIETLTLAQYFCELSLFLYPDDVSSVEFLRLILNSLQFLTENKINKYLLKAITELRVASISGYAPNLIACEKCGKYEDDFMFFRFSDGSLFCKDCLSGQIAEKISLDILKAMRHIVYSDFNKIYSFSLSEENAKKLSAITEKYITYQTERNFKTLEFYKSLASDT